MSSIHSGLQAARSRLQTVSTSASLDAQLLLAEVLSISRASVLAHPERELTPEQAATYEALILRRAAGEPIAYILGRRAFYDREFIVTPAVLIPRPETEHVLEEAISYIKVVGVQQAAPLQDLLRSEPLIAVDVGTGSGALAVTLAALAPSIMVYATDISPDALTVARQNADAQGVNVTFLQGDLLTPLIERGIHAHLIMANLPYIASDEVPTLSVSQYEPRLALDGGPDGLDLVRRLLGQAPQVCHPDALILLEIGATQGAAAVQAARDLLAPADVTLIKDYAGHDRVVKIHIGS